MLSPLHTGKQRVTVQVPLPFTFQCQPYRWIPSLHLLQLLPAVCRDHGHWHAGHSVLAMALIGQDLRCTGY